MAEKRRFNRWYANKEKDALISSGQIKEKVKILDIGAGGMKVSLSQPISIGSIIQGEFKILPHLGVFFVKGRVTRIEEKEGVWEAAIEFEKISSAKI